MAVSQIKFDINLIFMVFVEERDLKECGVESWYSLEEYLSKTEEIMEVSGSGV